MLYVYSPESKQNSCKLKYSLWDSGNVVAKPLPIILENKLLNVGYHKKWKFSYQALEELHNFLLHGIEVPLGYCISAYIVPFLMP